MNVQSRGYVTLESSDATAKPIIHPQYLEHPYDRLLLKTAIREALRWLDAPSLKKWTKGSILCPSSADDEDVEVGLFLFKDPGHVTDYW
jgi:hypothetical protein